jgi:Undecaprenyl-phosphate glucose phosphotransferase
MMVQFRRYSLVLRATIFILPLISFAVARFICVYILGITPDLSVGHDLYLVMFTTMVWSIAAEKREVTSIAKISAEYTGLYACLAACGITYVANLIALFVAHSAEYSRVYLLISALLLLSLSVLVRTAFRVLLRQMAVHRAPVRVVILGAGRFAARAARRLQRNEFVHCRIQAYIQIPDEEVRVSNAQVIQLSDLDTIESLNVDDIVVAVSPDRYGDLGRYISKLRDLGKPIRIMVDAGNTIRVRDRVVQIGRFQMLDLDPSPASSVRYFLVKRAFDLTFAGLVLLVGAPSLLIIAALIRLTSPGPILFRQQRVGKDGRVFTMYKFRTMRVGSAEEGDTKWTTANDPRRTRFGAFLRSTSLDELPQFFNVLKGDMSVVGPRPERPHFVKKFRSEIANYQNRHHLNVGITGWAQVNGLRGDTSIQKRIRYDLYYLQHWSLAFDLRIIVMTLFGRFMDKNAY